MTEEQGGEQIGQLYTEIGGDISPLIEALAEGVKKLEAFIANEYKAKIGVQFENTGGASTRPQGLIDRHGKQIGAAIGQAALGQIEGSLGKIKDVKVEATPKVDKDTLTAAIQGSLNGHAFKLTLDQGYIRDQIQQALGHGFQLGVGGAAATGAPAAQANTHFAEEFDKRLQAQVLRKATKNEGALTLNEALPELAAWLRDEQGRSVSGTGGTSALSDIVDDLGDDVSKWTENLAKLTPDTALAGEIEKLTKKFFLPSGQLHQDFFANRQAPQPVAQIQQSGTFVAQAAQTIARAIHEEVPATTEAQQVRRGTLADQTFVGKPFNQDVVAQFLGKYFTPELTRLEGSKNQPDFAALANLAELRPAEKQGRIAPVGERLIEFDPESKSEDVARLRRNKPVRFQEGVVSRLPIGQVLRRGFAQLRGQPEDEFPPDVEERLARLTEVAENAAANVQTVKPGKENRSGILAQGTSLESFARQDVQLDELVRLIAKLRSGRFGASKQRRVAALSAERDRLIEAGASPIGNVPPLERRILRDALRRSSAQSRANVDAGLGLTTGEIREREKAERRQTEASRLAAPYTERIAALPEQIRSRKIGVGDIPINRYVGREVAKIRAEAQDAFGGKLPSGVGQEIAAAKAAAINVLNPRAGGEAVPRGAREKGGTPSGFRTGASFAEQDVVAAERPGATPTGIVRPPLQTNVTRRIGELEAKLGLSASDVARSETSPQQGVDAQTQFLSRRVNAEAETGRKAKDRQRQLAIEASRKAGLATGKGVNAGLPSEDTLSQILGTGPINDNRISAARKTYQRARTKDPILAALKEEVAAAKATDQQSFEELNNLRRVHTEAISFIEKNQNLGTAGVLAKAESRQASGKRRVPAPVATEVADLLRTPAPGTRESGEINSIARVLGRSFKGERNQPLSGDQVRDRYSRIAGAPPGELSADLRETIAAAITRGREAGEQPPGEPPTAGGAPGGFGGFPIPLPVSIVQSIPLTIMGGGGAARTARDGGAASAEEETTPVLKERKNIQYLPNRALSRAAQTAGEREQGRIEQLRTSAGERSFKESETARKKDLTDTARGFDKLAASLGTIFDAEDRRVKKAAADAAKPVRPQRFNKLGIDYGILGGFQDEAQDEIEGIKGKQRRARRLVPSRGFGASLTDLVTSLAGGPTFEKQLGRLSRIETEGGELQRLTGQRAGFLAQRSAAQQALVNLPAKSPERAARQTEIADLDKKLRQLNPAIDASNRKFTENYKELTKGTNVLKGFVAAGAGAVASAGVGSITFGLGLAVTGPIIQAIGEGFTQIGGSFVERLTGNIGTAAREQQALGTGVRAAGGRAEVAFAQAQLQTGLGPTQAGQIGGVLTKRAQIEAGNQAFREQLDQFRAAQKFEQQNQGGLGDAALGKNLTGFLGSSFGGTPSFSETLGDLFQNVPANFGGGVTPEQEAQRATLEERRGALEKQITEGRSQVVSGRGFSINQTKLDLENVQHQIDALGESTEGSSAALDFFTARAKDSGVDLKAVAGGTLSEAERQAQASALNQAGLQRQAQQVKAGQVGFQTNAGQTITNPQQLVDLFTKIATNTPKPSPEAFLETQAPQIKAQQYLLQRQTEFNLQQQPIQEGIAVGQQPFLPATAGIAPADAAKYKGELSGVQTIFNQITNEAAAARQQAVAFFREAFPGNDQGATQFADALGNAADYGQQIAKIQLGVQTAQAALAAKQYSFEIFQVKRSLSDALALQGKITSGANNLGVIERQQFELQRQAQALGLAQSQRQINFQRSIAGLTAPGLTGEERAARIEQAKIEADYAQKQLDIQKKLFGLGGKQFQITADRNVQDLTNQLGLLQAGREVVLRTAVAEKQIQALTALQARENKRIQTFYQAAVDATTQVMQLEAQLVAATEVGLNKVGNLVLNQFRKVYSGLIAELNGGSSTTQNPPKQKPGTPFATGGLFNTTGATDITVGEAGSETVAVLRNPRSVTGSFSGGGGTTQIVIDLRGATVSDEKLLAKVTRDVQAAVERGIARKGDLYGLR